MDKVLADKNIQFNLPAADFFRFPTANTQGFFQVLLGLSAMQSQKNKGSQESLQAISPSSNGWEGFDYTCAKKKIAE